MPGVEGKVGRSKPTDSLLRARLPTVTRRHAGCHARTVEVPRDRCAAFWGVPSPDPHGEDTRQTGYHPLGRSAALCLIAWQGLAADMVNGRGFSCISPPNIR
jgi:hypothetical protein